MPLDNALIARIKVETLRFTTVEVEQFLLAHPDKTFMPLLLTPMPNTQN